MGNCLVFAEKNGGGGGQVETPVYPEVMAFLFPELSEAEEERITGGQTNTA